MFRKLRNTCFLLLFKWDARFSRKLKFENVEKQAYFRVLRLIFWIINNCIRPDHSLGHQILIPLSPNLFAKMAQESSFWTIAKFEEHHNICSILVKKSYLCIQRNKKLQSKDICDIHFKYCFEFRKFWNAY